MSCSQNDGSLLIIKYMSAPAIYWVAVRELKFRSYIGWEALVITICTHYGDLL